MEWRKDKYLITDDPTRADIDFITAGPLVAMAVEGQWRTYSITLAWSGFDETLRLICTYKGAGLTLAEIRELLEEAG